MSIEWLTILMVASIAGLLVIGLPLAFVTGIVAVGFAIVQFGDAGLSLVASRIYSFMNAYVLVAVPMFIMMAAILERSGVARDLFRAMHVFSGSLRGVWRCRRSRSRW